MAVDKNKDKADDVVDDDAGDDDTPDPKQFLSDIIDERLDAWFKKNKPAPSRTKASETPEKVHPLDFLFGKMR